MARSDRYLKLLLILLISATFFEGYDSSILALLLPNIQATFHASEALLGLTRIPIELGLFVAFFLARYSDRVGRRPILLWSVIGYTVFAALTAFSWNIWAFTFFQFGSRVFLGAEFAVAITMVVEEFPIARRARALGTLLTFEGLGTIMVAVLLGLGLQNTSLDWRAFFLVGIVPLIVLTFLRRRMHETERFIEEKARRERGESTPRTPFLAAWAPKYRRNLVLVGMVYLMRSIPFFGATAWWAYYAERERGFTETQVAIYILVAYGIGCVGYYVCGRLMERIGRRPTAIIYFLGGVVFSIILFQTTDRVVAFFALMLAVGFGLGVQPVLSAFGTELFPTEIRGQSAAWVRNWFEIAGYVFGPALVGILGDHSTGAIGNIGDTVSLLMIMQLPGIFLIWRHMPETKGHDIDQITPEEALLTEAPLT
ncbi:MAG: MFS transporter [Acidimicrobiia bacterium]|nr:MFS transporter [Acidimicrobiia bacterium]